MAVGGAGFWAYRVLFPSPEKVIRKQLLELARSASYDSNESALARLANGQKVAGFFTSDAEIRFDAPGRGQQSLDGRDEILQAIMAGNQPSRPSNSNFRTLLSAWFLERTRRLPTLRCADCCWRERHLYPGDELSFGKIEGGGWWAS
jgi:hypothetical protein